MKTVRCAACGTENASDHKFCKECGGRLLATASGAPTAAPDSAVRATDDPGSRAFQYGLRGMYDEAIVEYIRALRLRPDSAELHFQLASVYRKKNLLESAISELNRAIEIDSAHFKALLSLGNIYGEDVRDHRRAIEMYERAVALMPDYPDLRNNLGNAYRFIGEHEKAVEQFEKAIDLNPSYARAIFNLGKALSALGRLHEAEGCYRRAIEIDANHPKAHKNLGVTLRELGRHEEALTPLLKAVELDPNYAKAHLQLAGLYEHIGLAEKAKGHRETALMLKPELEEVASSR